ncbi:TIGR03790 family protein [Haliea sp. E17]|uniref:TIGR03790 family protein n=1 Tax=Haliea sp. E17 TaxID=3401576 RepID=UPI003AAD9D1C
MQQRNRLLAWIAILSISLGPRVQADAALPRVALPDAGLQPAAIGVVVNDRDPLSERIAQYYLEKHGIPPANLLHVDFNPAATRISAAEFAQGTAAYRAALSAKVRGLALAWTQPYQVGCMSITSAFSVGYDEQYCASGCQPTALNNYARSNRLDPLAGFGIRPSMMLAAATFADARALIDRGAASRGWYYRQAQPSAAAWLVETSDQARSVRKAFYREAAQRFGRQLEVHVEKTDTVEHQRNIMFYFTGARTVPGIASNDYLPGAVADHLTSTGGKLTGGRQMSAMDWLEAGATGSYGTVVEPCNFPAKFPHPARLMEQYLGGRTLLEAYWKSVLSPGQGVFIGDPLAAPFQGYRIGVGDKGLELHSSQLLRGNYRLQGANQAEGPYRTVGDVVRVSGSPQVIALPEPHFDFYRLTPLAL